MTAVYEYDAPNTKKQLFDKPDDDWFYREHYETEGKENKPKHMSEDDLRQVESCDISFDKTGLEVSDRDFNERQSFDSLLNRVNMLKVKQESATKKLPSSQVFQKEQPRTKPNNDIEKEVAAEKIRSKKVGSVQKSTALGTRRDKTNRDINTKTEVKKVARKNLTTQSAYNSRRPISSTKKTVTSKEDQKNEGEVKKIGKTSTIQNSNIRKKVTVPKTPNFLTNSRIQNRKQRITNRTEEPPQFKAKPVSRKMLDNNSGDIGVPRIESRKTTVPVPFTFHTTTSRHRAPKSTVSESEKSSEKTQKIAKPSTKAKLKPKQKPTLTVPHSPKFSKRFNSHENKARLTTEELNMTKIRKQGPIKAHEFNPKIFEPAKPVAKTSAQVTIPITPSWCSKSRTRSRVRMNQAKNQTQT